MLSSQLIVVGWLSDWGERHAEFDKIVLADNIPIDYTILAKPLYLLSYIETWQVQLFDHAFLHYYRGTDLFTKAKEFNEYRGMDLVVKRVIFRYVNHFGASISISSLSSSFQWCNMMAVTSWYAFTFASFSWRYMTFELYKKDAIKKSDLPLSSATSLTKNHLLLYLAMGRFALGQLSTWREVHGI